MIKDDKGGNIVDIRYVQREREKDRLFCREFPYEQ